MLASIHTPAVNVTINLYQNYSECQQLLSKHTDRFRSIFNAPHKKLVPRKDLVTEMAKILDVNPLTLHEPTTMNASELMEIQFWIDEFNPGMINFFQLETYPGEKSNSSDDIAVRYHDSDSWPAHSPVGMWFNYGVLNDFLKEWTLRKEELKSGAITRDEYFEWKINWPSTCDDGKESKYYVPWRKEK